MLLRYVAAALMAACLASPASAQVCGPAGCSAVQGRATVVKTQTTRTTVRTVQRRRLSDTRFLWFPGQRVVGVLLMRR